MKKTLVALAVTAFAASASAVTVYDAEGTKVQVDGSLRLVLEQASSKTKYANGQTVKNKNAHSQLRNAGSRFGVRVNHDLGNDFYALGRLEIRFDKNNSDDQFGDLYAKRAYVGLGSKQYGEVTFGRQLTIADDYGQTDDYEYGIVPSYIATSGNQVIRYDYKGIEGLQIGANYNFAEKRDAAGEVLPNELKNAYGLGAVYETQLGGNTFNVEGGIGRSNYATGTNHKHYQDGYEIALGYTIGDLKLVGDFGYKYEKDGSERTKAFFVAPGFQYQVIPASRIYGNYLYERAETTVAKADSAKEKTHGFLLGVDYQFHKQVVAFVEGKYVQTKDYDAVGNGYSYNGKTTDKAIGVGMRVYW
ncbi:porin [Actinobacillus suis]|uniref:Outer membrane protein P2-like protein n=2 Tax=Actinobacillus suis TaxID=716 RepID=K0GB19_ACTSU|nr:porin [Actinobacillus suis]AFU18900.1 outer membrane protein P2-like protein [Actinobacillus suis H91-0380]AIJ30978.1 outer membrane protein P2-like protein [Actinobacillus suis ATCC 33415]MCO4166890.1 porin [Actinobacillus suis]MCO4168238.1 porin [Actinobacillus suis]MCQ9628885.1 porin [Actinobacillus suis]